MSIYISKGHQKENMKAFEYTVNMRGSLESFSKWNQVQMPACPALLRKICKESITLLEIYPASPSAL